MTRSIVRTILVVLSVATLYMSLAPEAPAQTCSLATVAGSWAATLTGTILFPAPTGPVPAAAVLRFNLDTAGNVSGTEARNVGGGFANETIKGTFTVNPNCTGTTTVQFFQSGALVRTSVLAIVFATIRLDTSRLKPRIMLFSHTLLPFSSQWFD